MGSLEEIVGCACGGKCLSLAREELGALDKNSYFLTKSLVFPITAAKKKHSVVILSLKKKMSYNFLKRYTEIPCHCSNTTKNMFLIFLRKKNNSKKKM